MPEKKNYKGLSAEDWIKELDSLFSAASNNELTQSRLAKHILELVELNPQLQLVKYVKQYLIQPTVKLIV